MSCLESPATSGILGDVEKLGADDHDGLRAAGVMGRPAWVAGQVAWGRFAGDDGAKLPPGDVQPAAGGARQGLGGTGTVIPAERPRWRVLRRQPAPSRGRAWRSQAWRNIVQSLASRRRRIAAAAQDPACGAQTAAHGKSAQAAPSQPADAFLLEAAHDLRGRLQAFEFTLTGLVDHAGTSEGQTGYLVQGLQRSAIHLQTLLENLLDTAGIGANLLHLRPERLDLAEVLEEVILAVEPLLAPRGQRIAVDLPPEPTFVVGDVHRIRQVLVNLLHNAIKYGPRDEVIRVRVVRAGAVAQIAVVDRGGGIPRAEQARLFDRFFRGSAARGGERGSGLGLALSKAIVEAHGGAIGVESGPLTGTAFWFTLPLG